MPPLARYYTAWAINLVAFVGFLLTKIIVIGGIMMATLLCIGFICCPVCKSRVGKNRASWVTYCQLKSA